MKLNCDFCGEYLSDADENCPHCGAKNAHYLRKSDEAPQTIEELKQWYRDHNLPAEEITRFFIGKDCHEAKAFGIYQDGNRFIVYKNKADGSRAIRYDGGDESYAVNELYMKLRERIAEEKAKNGKGRNKKNKKNVKENVKDGLFIFGLFAVVIGIAVAIAIRIPTQGYYSYEGDQYYYLDDSWYIYDSDWNYTTVDKELEKNYNDYYESDYYDSSYGTSDFKDTSYYSTWEASNNDWDSDSTWDSGDSWDSGGGDWNSDW